MKTKLSYIDEFIHTWLVHNQTAWPDSDLREWCLHDPERAWEVICALVEQELNDSQMGSLGAGPIERLMMRHGPQFIDRLESLAASNQTFRECLKRSYPTGPNDEIKRRMGIASAVSWVDYSSERAEVSRVLVRFNRQWGLRERLDRGQFVGMSVTREATDPELMSFGLVPGDVIVSANGVAFSNATHAREVLVELSGPRTVKLEIVRNGERIVVVGGNGRAGA
jgi:hypothetical protein